MWLGRLEPRTATHCFLFLSVPFSQFVDLPTTIQSFKRIAAGEFDHLPEQAFYMVGPLAEVEEKAARIIKETAERVAKDKEEEAKKKAAASA